MNIDDDIQKIIHAYLESVEKSIATTLLVKSSNSGIYQNSVGATGYITFYPNADVETEIEFVLDISMDKERLTIKGDICTSEGKILNENVLNLKSDLSRAEAILNESSMTTKDKILKAISEIAG